MEMFLVFLLPYLSITYAFGACSILIGIMKFHMDRIDETTEASSARWSLVFILIGLFAPLVPPVFPFYLIYLIIILCKKSGLIKERKKELEGPTRPIRALK
jgi:uncharacterized membrane protein HdeD (DUF308 family)